MSELRPWASGRERLPVNTEAGNVHACVSSGATCIRDPSDAVMTQEPSEQFVGDWFWSPESGRSVSPSRDSRSRCWWQQ